jgi:hypothetical protein
MYKKEALASGILPVTDELSEEFPTLLAGYALKDQLLIIDDSVTRDS